MLRIGLDRIGVRPAAPDTTPARRDACPADGAIAELRRTALVCPRCGRVLGGI